ncbi:MAG: NHL repeat-containing protein [bacterium]
MKRDGFFIAWSVLWLWLLLCAPLSDAAIAEYLKENISPAIIIRQFNNQLALGQPVDVYVDSTGNMYVVDLYNKSVFIYDSNYLPLSRLDTSNGLKGPTAVAVDQKGNMYVSDADRGILVFNSIGKLLRKIDLDQMTKGKVRYAKDLIIDQKDNLYLATGTEEGVLILDPEGKLKAAITPLEPGKEGMPPKLAAITHVTLDSSGRIYLLSETMGKVYVYENPDTFLFGFGQKGGSFGKLSRPAGITVDRAKELIFVTDYMRHTLSIYNLDGVFLQEYGGLGEKAGWFSHPNQTFLDKEQRLVIADSFNHRLQVLTIHSR